MSDLLNLSPLTIEGCITAILCGFIIGFERQWIGKPASIRTSILICLSAYIFVALGHFYQPEEGTIRVIGQIVTGVGFLGAGVIISRDGLVQGVTSAAVIWILAAIGCLIGLENLRVGIVLAIATVVILVGITFLEKMTKRLRRGVHKSESFE